MLNHIFDEHSGLTIGYTVYDGTEVCVDVSDCFYEDTDIKPLPSDFDLKTEKELVKYLEDIVYEALDEQAEQYMDEQFEDDLVWAKHYAEEY